MKHFFYFKRQFSQLAQQKVKSARYLEELCIEPFNNTFCIKLKDKMLKVPGTKDPIIVPSPLLADLLIAEWQGHSTLPDEKPALLSSLLFRANELEKSPNLRHQLINDLIKYLHTDSICFFETTDKLHSMQNHIWKPIINDLEEKLNTPICITNSLIGSNQSTELTEKCINELTSYSAYSISGFECLVRSMKSFLLPLALKKSIIDPQTAVKAALLESDFQETQWGTFSEAHDIQRESLRRQTYLATLLLMN